MTITTGINYIKGDATQPVGDGLKVILHICNDKGQWGRGFVVALSNRWRKPEIDYRNWYHEGMKSQLGDIQCCKVEDDIHVINLIAQHDTRAIGWRPPIRYGALYNALCRVRDKYIHHHWDGVKISFHCPRMGAGLAGGEWPAVEGLLYETIVDAGFNVTVYDLP